MKIVFFTVLFLLVFCQSAALADEYLICDIDVPGGKAEGIKAKFFTGEEINVFARGNYLPPGNNYGLFMFDNAPCLVRIITPPPYKSKSSCVGLLVDSSGKKQHWRILIR